MRVTVKLEVTSPILDLDLFFWLNDNVGGRIFRNCSNNKDTFEIDLEQTDSLNIDVIIYAMTGSDYTLKYSAKRADGKKCSVQEPTSPIENTVQKSNLAHELITIKL